MAFKILEIDIAKPLERICFSKDYIYYRALIRQAEMPLGWITFSKNDADYLLPEELYEFIEKQLNYTLVHTAFTRSFEIKSQEQSNEGISVIVCTRNRTQQLANCIQSLLALDYPKFEIIIVDNAPDNDATYQLTASLPVRYVREGRPGLDWARNKGILEASYPIVAFTDDDVRVDTYWLKSIAKALSNNEVMGISGYVAPAELDTIAQRMFELKYGSMGHGFKRYTLRKEHCTKRQLLWTSSFSIGANMAFRKEVFSKVGLFDTALDVGTPSHGGGDIEMFHRLLINNQVVAYEPSMLIWHYHRREVKALRKQISDNGRSFGCYLINCFKNKTVSRAFIIRFFFRDWLGKWVLYNLFSRYSKIPKSLALAEFKGMLTCFNAYRKTKASDKRLKKQFGMLKQSKVRLMHVTAKAETV